MKTIADYGAAALPHGESESRLAASVRALREAQDELTRRERLAALGELAGNVAHEMRAPLSVIQNAAFFLEQSLPAGDAEVAKVLGEMKRAITRSKHILSELLDYVREPVPNETDFPIGDAISSALQLVPLSKEIHLLVPATEAGKMEVHGNQEQVIGILVNLIQNAAQAMPEGGDLGVDASRDAGTVFVDVRDTGCGIPVENLDKIFEPLFTTKINGIGLGLAIAQRYAQLNGGRLSVDSQTGRGTTFRLVLRTAP